MLTRLATTLSSDTPGGGVRFVQKGQVRSAQHGVLSKVRLELVGVFRMLHFGGRGRPPLHRLSRGEGVESGLAEGHRKSGLALRFKDQPGGLWQGRYCLPMILPLMSTLSSTTMLAPVSGPPSITR